MAAEALGEDAVTEAAVADGQRSLAELVHHRPDDARAGQDDFGALGLQADDRAALGCVARAVRAQPPLTEINKAVQVAGIAAR